MFRRLALTVLLLTTSSEIRADRYFVGLPSGGTSNWNNSSNWSATAGGPGGAGVPGPGDVAFVQYSDPLDRTVVLDVSATTAGLQVANNGGGTMTLVQSAGSDLSTSSEYLGIYNSEGVLSFGAHIQQGGTNNTGLLAIGNDFGQLIGAYTINGGTLNASSIFVSETGGGTFLQNGGFVSGAVHIGDGGSHGVYTFNAGTLHATSFGMANGYLGDCTFTQSGGTSVIGGITVGNGDMQTGTIFLNGAGASMTVTGGERYGFHGNGAFEQSAGTHSVGAGGIYMGGSSGWGRYDLTGGTLTVLGPVVMANNGGTFNQTGGVATIGTISANQDLTIHQGRGTLSGSASLAVYGNEILDGGYATFSQQAGRHSISGTLSVDSHFLLAGGSLQVGGDEVLGQRLDQADFVQTAGNHSVGGTLSIAGQGINDSEFDLQGGSLVVNGPEIVGGAGFGKFVQSGNSVHVVNGPLKIGATSVGQGSFQLTDSAMGNNSGAILYALGGEYVGDPGLGMFEQSGGHHSVGTTSANQDLWIGHNGGTGIYTLDGTEPYTELDVYGTEFIGHGGSTGSLRQVNCFNQATTGVVVGDDSGGAGTYTMTHAGLIAGMLDVRKTGTLNFIARYYASGSIDVGTMSVAGHVTFAPDSYLTAVVKALSINNVTGKFDLGDNKLIVDYTGAVGTALDDVRESLHAGALFTSAGTSANRIGYGDNAALHLTWFGQRVVDPSSVLITYTYGGDANLDGKVDVTDLGALASNWQAGGVWTAGDFNYDGFVDVSDLGILAANWQATASGSPLSDAAFDQALASVGLAGVPVPEPSLFLITFGVLLLLKPLAARARLGSARQPRVVAAK